MSWRVAEEPEEGDDDELGEDDGPEEEVEIPSAEDDDDEVEPLTHLSQEDYDAFVARELGSDGRVRGDPPVTAWLIGLTLLIVVVWLLLA